jgi:phosphoglycerate dehydrogenase-like enzyme
MPRILVTPIEVVYQQGACQEVLQQAGFEIVYPPRGVRLYEPDLLIDHLVGVDGMIAGMEPLSRRVLESSKLRAVARMGVGYDAIDVQAATERGVAVTISPGTNQVSVAEHTLALLLGVMRGFPQRDQAVRTGQWGRKLLPRLAGRTIGLVGLGRIGKAVVPRAQALELNVIAHDPLADRDFAARAGVPLCSLDELLAAADIVSLHLPCTPQTTRLIDRKALAKMRQGAILINTARGGLVDEEALADALTSGHLGGAGLDAFVVEPLPTTSRLLTCENVLLSPHTAGVDQESIVAMARLAAECIVALHRTGRAPDGCLVNPEIGPAWKWS